MKRNTSINGNLNFVNSIKKNKIKRVMEITYEVIEQKTQDERVNVWGCFAHCEENNDCGADHWCCERIKSA